jgi:hypothetical protein
MTRKTISTVCILLFLLFGYAAITVPMFEMAGPTIIAIACAAVAWLIWPKKAKQPA